MKHARSWKRLLGRAAVTLGLAAVSVAALTSREPSAPVRVDPVVVTAPIRVAGSIVKAPARSFERVRAMNAAGAKAVARAGRAARFARALTGEEMAVSVTAYCLRGLTRRDNPVRPGIIAADPRVFPLGSKVELYVGTHYLGRFLVDDTGGVIKGNKIDVWTPECREARRFGRRKGKAMLVTREAPTAPVPDVTRLLP